MSLARSAIATAVVVVAFTALAQQMGGEDGNTPDAGLPAGAAPPAANQAPAVPPPAASQPAAPKVDESALRYFASQGDTRRVEAEIARLRALYPNWTPPSDLSQPSAGPVIARDPLLDRLWTLYTEDRFAEIRAAIAERQSSDPQWKPPQELMTALETAEARRRLINASDNGQWQTVLSTATDAQQLLTCANVDILWRVAEAYAKTDQPNRAQDAYTYILTNCNDPAERISTLQKALTLLPEQQIADLLRLERKEGANPDDFSSIRDELARRRVERVATDPKLTASGEDLGVVERLARAGEEPGNALLLGWYNYHHDNPAKALEWFKTAMDRNGGAKAAEGYALSLQALDRLVEAEALAYEWRDKTPENMNVYLDVATALLSQDPPLRLDPAIPARIVSVAAKERSADAAQGLGWYSYNTGQITTARQWFETALDWKPDNEASAYGLALAAQRLRDRRSFNAILAQWRDRSQRIADLAAGIRSRSATGTTPQPAPRQTIRSTAAPYSTISISRETVETYGGAEPAPARSGGRRTCTATHRNPAHLSADAALTLGWCLMEIDRPLEAVAAFDQAVRNGSPRTREEAAYGKTLAYLRKNLTGQAAVAAAETPQTGPRRTELQATILAQRALAAYRDGRYAETILALGERARIVPEQTDLMVIKGWAYLKLGRFDDAEQIFRAAYRTGSSRDAAAGLNAVRAARNPGRYYD